MKIFIIEPIKTKHKGYEKAVFLINSGGIYSESPSFGFMQRDDMTVPRLTEHLDTMKKEGFSVTELNI